MTYDEMLAICAEQRENDGFCRVCSSCSGPSISNLGCDYPHADGVTIYRGGNYGSCYFDVEEVC